MANPAVGQAAAGLSAFLGILVIASSAVFLSDWRKPYDDCSEYVGGSHEECRPYRYFVVGAATGIVVGILQALSSVLGFMKKGKAWVAVQALVIFLLICAYAVPVSEEAYNIMDIDIPYLFSIYRWKALAFLSIVSTDIACTLILMLVTFMTS